MDIELQKIDTKGYSFKWRVAPSGYELVGGELYRYPGSITGPWFGYYYPNHIFYKVHLLARRWNGALKPYYPDNLSPWLVRKGTQAQQKEMELAAVEGRPVEGVSDLTGPQEYEPMSDLSLHRKFARLKVEDLENEALRFANKYGLLGRRIHLHPVKSGLPVEGESLYRWRAEIEKMGVLLVIWDWIRRGDTRSLRQIVHWLSDNTGWVGFKWKGEKGHYELSAESEEDDDESGYGHAGADFLSTQYRRGDVIGPATGYLCEGLNFHLQEIRPLLVPRRSACRVAYVPSSLLDALWLMFMLEVEGAVRSCWHCGRAFEPTRKDNVYCCGNCKRMAHYYNKQRNRGEE